MSEDSFGGWGMPMTVYGFIILVALIVALVIVLVSDSLVDAWRWAELTWKARRLRRSARRYSARMGVEGSTGTIYKSKGKRKR